MDKRRSDPQGTDRKLVIGEKRDLIKEFGIAPSRVTALGSGYQKLESPLVKYMTPAEAGGFLYLGRTVELWLAPEGRSRQSAREILKSIPNSSKGL